MIIIAHRGNLDGENEQLENHPAYIQNAIDNNFQGIFHVSGNKRLSKFKFGILLKECFSESRSILTEKKISKNSIFEDRSLKRSKEFMGLIDLKHFFNTIKL